MERLLIKRILEILKIGKTNKLGLFTGNTGICLALYMLAKKYGISDAVKIADGLLEEVVQNISQINNTNFDDGLAGIGYAVSLLSEYDCVTGDIDNILYEIDAAIYKAVTSEKIEFSLDCTKGLVGYMIYYVTRLSNRKHSCSGWLDRLDRAALRVVIDRIEKLAPLAFASISRDLYITALWEIPLMFVYIRKTMELGVHTHKIKSMVLNWTIYIRGNIPYYDINKLMLASALAYLNGIINNVYIEKQIEMLIFSVDFDNLEKEIDNRIESVNEGWLLTAYVLLQAEKYIGNKNKKYNQISSARKRITNVHLSRTEEKLKDPKKMFDVSFVNGLSGMAFLYAFCPNVFHK